MRRLLATEPEARKRRSRLWLPVGRASMCWGPWRRNEQRGHLERYGRGEVKVSHDSPASRWIAFERCHRTNATWTVVRDAEGGNLHRRRDGAH
jgi:hypothetical protein